MKPHEFSRADRDLRRLRQYLETGQFDAAQAAAESLTRAFPQLALGWFWRSLVHQAQGNLTFAVVAAERAIQLDDQRAEVHAHIACCHLLRGDSFLALQSAQRAQALEPKDPIPLDGIAAVFSQCGDHLRAKSLYEQAAALAPEHAAIAVNLGNTLTQLGEFDAAEAAFERALSVAPRQAEAHWALAQLRPWTETDHHLDRLDRLLAHSRPGSSEAALIDFARAKELDDLGRVDTATEALQRANQAMQQRLRFSLAADARVFDALDAVAGSLIDAAPADRAATNAAGSPTPIFIVGMPRSGTSLVERLLGNHPEVRLGGELQDFSVCVKRELGLDGRAFVDDHIIARLPGIDWARVGDAYRARLTERFGRGGYVTDKLPGNHAYVAAIAAALPEARIVHVVRDPMDTCYAIYRQMLGAVYPFAYDQEILATHYVRYAAWMRRCESGLPKRIFPLRYEQLVSVPGLVTRQLYRYCGLEWVDGGKSGRQ